MTLNELIAHLEVLKTNGHGELEVYATHSGSGACDPVGHAFLREIDGEEPRYIDIYIGN